MAAFEWPRANWVSESVRLREHLRRNVRLGSGLCAVGIVDVLVGLLVGLLDFSLGVGRGFQLLNRFTQTLGRRSGHLSFQLVKGNIQVMGYMHGRDKLAQIFKSLRGLLQVGSCGQKALQFTREFGVV